MSDEIENAKIESTMLGVEDHGILTFMITVSGDGWGQGFGGYGLDGYNKKLDRREGWAPGLILIRAILEALEVDEWEKLEGRYCRIKRDGPSFQGMIRAIGHPVKNKWADIRDFTKEETK